jgi:hypothetical protein
MWLLHHMNEILQRISNCILYQNLACGSVLDSDFVSNQDSARLALVSSLFSQ